MLGTRPPRVTSGAVTAATTSAPSPIWGTHFGLTNETASKVLTPAAARSSISFALASVGMKAPRDWSPSRGDDSVMWTRSGKLTPLTVPRGKASFVLGRLPFDQGERMRMIQERLVQPEQDLRRRAGLDEHGRLLGESAFDRTLVLDMVPTSLAPWPRQWASHVWHPLLPETHESGGDHDWVDSLEGPVVSISLGTLFGNPGLYERVTRAALDVGASVVAVTRFDLGIEHDALTQVSWASMDRLLPKTDVFVHHGGWGSTISGLASGP